MSQDFLGLQFGDTITANEMEKKTDYYIGHWPCVGVYRGCNVGKPK